MRSTIALVGPIAGGKGTVGDILIEKGYTPFTYRSVVQDEILRRGLPLERAVFQDVSDSLRLEFGTDILARRIAGVIEQERQEGLRAQGERLQAVQVTTGQHLAQLEI